MPIRRPARKMVHKRKGAGKLGKHPKRVPRLNGLRHRSIQTATITEVSDDTTFSTNTSYLGQINIQQFPRALEVAKSFRFYRAKYVKFIYTPEYNVFQEGSGSTKPYFFYVMNRNGDTTAPSVAGMEQQGAVPISFSKEVAIKYKPNLCQAINVANATGNVAHMIGMEPVYDKWLATEYAVGMGDIAGGAAAANGDAYQPVYNCPYYVGHWVNVRAVSASQSIIGSWCVEVVWEFKDAQIAQTPTTH